MRIRIRSPFKQRRDGPDWDPLDPHEAAGWVILLFVGYLVWRYNLYPWYGLTDHQIFGR